MQVKGQIIHQKTVAPEAPLELKQGEVYSASIKEKMNNSEAILQIRGKDVHVKFADGVPADQGRITVQVNGQSDGHVNVKTIATESSKNVSSENKVLASLGLSEKDSSVVKQAVKTLLEKGSPLTKEIVSDLKNFMTDGKDTVESKLETVRSLANKRLEATQPQLRAVHEALHGKPLNEVLSNLAKEIDPTFKLEKAPNLQKESTPTSKLPAQNIASTFQKEATQQVNGQQEPAKITLQKSAVTNDIANNKTEATPSPMSKENATVKNTSELSELIRKSRQLVEKEPDLKKAIQQIREEIIKNPKLDRELANSINKATQEAEKLQTVGKERLVQALKSAEEMLLKQEQQTIKSATAESQSISVKDSQSMKLSETVKNINVEVSKNPNLNQSIEKVKEQIVENQSLPKELSEKVKLALTAASSLAKQGRVTVGKAVLSQVLTEVQNTLEQIEGKVNHQIKLDQNSNQTSSETVKNVKDEIHQEPNLQKAVEKVRVQVVNNPKIDREVVQKVDRALKETVSLQKVGQEPAGRERLQQTLAKAEVDLKQIESRQPAQQTQVSNSTGPRSSEIVRNVKSEIQQEPNLQKAVEKVRDQVVNNPKVEREVSQKVEQALKEMISLQKVGQESAGKERLQQVLAKAEVELKQIESRQPAQQAQVSSTTESRPSDIVKNVKAEIQQEPNLQKAVEKVRDQVVNNAKIDPEVTQKVEQALKETISLQKVGQEPAAREGLQQALAKAELELKQIESRQQISPTQPVQSEGTVQERDAIKQIQNLIKTEPNTTKIAQKVQEFINNNKSINPETAQNLDRLAKQAHQLDQAGRQRLTNMLQQVESTLQQDLEKISNSSVKQTDIQRNQTQTTNAASESITAKQVLPSESINKALKALQTEPNLEEALAKVRKELTSNPNIDLKTVNRAENSLNSAQHSLDKGREMAARQQLTNELNSIGQEMIKTEPKVATESKAIQNAMQYDLNEQLQALGLQSKDILVTKVSQQLAQVTHDFREIKREITRNLDQAERIINNFKQHAYPHAKQAIEEVIGKLDKAILKSDMMLFTDMRTEKQLLQASTQLAEAKKLLSQGNHTEASKIVGEVKNMMEKINFKPSEQKIVHYVKGENEALQHRSPTGQLLTKMSDATYRASEPSPRAMYDMVRSLGLNHESDVANSLVFHKNEGASGQEQQQQNLKSILMKLTQGEEISPKLALQAEQALSNITGQQLLSKSDGNGTLQSMFFNLPLMLGEKPENLQVFINSKNEGEQVQWENCNLYFLLETKKLGDVGILLNSTDRNLSITIKNDLPGFKEKMEPIAQMTKEKLQEVGYNVSSINFAKMNPVHKQNMSHEEVKNEINGVRQTRQNFYEKGLNFTI